MNRLLVHLLTSYYCSHAAIKYYHLGVLIIIIIMIIIVIIITIIMIPGVLRSQGLGLGIFRF